MSQQPPQNSRLKRIGKKVLLLFASLAACLFMLECSMVVFEPWLPGTGQYIYDEEMGFRMRPQHWGSNEFGFNDVDYPHAKPKDTVRIMFLGDSFSWAGGDLNYVKIVRRLVGESRPDSKIEVLNTGYPMTHTGHQLDALKKFGLLYEPDVVVLSFYVGNDFIDGLPHRKRVVLNDCFYDIDDRQESFWFGYPMVGRSRLWTFIKQKLKIAGNVEWVGQSRSDVGKDAPEVPSVSTPSRDRQAIGKFAAADVRKFLEQLAKMCPPEAEKPMFTEDAYVNLVGNKMQICSTREGESGRFDPRIRYILAKIDEMHALLRAKGIRFFVGFFPDEFQFDPELRAQVYAKRGHTAADYELLRPQRLLESHLTKIGVRYLDFLQFLEPANEVRRVCHPRETHYNYFGNLVVGHAYYEFLVDEVLTELGRPRKK